MTKTTRYFKATDGEATAFRSSLTRAYISADVSKVSFSGKPASSLHGTVPAVEITKAEYDRLVVLKNERIAGLGHEPKGYTQPNYSWIHNAQLEGVEPRKFTSQLPDGRLVVQLLWNPPANPKGYAWKRGDEWTFGGIVAGSHQFAPWQKITLLPVVEG